MPAANIGDAQERLGIASGLRPMWAGARVAGRAFTVLCAPGDNLYLHKALMDTQPGDVLVISGGGDESRALLGEMIAIKAKALGVAGFIVDGAIRDAAEMAALEFPVFARAVTPAGPFKNGPGRLKEPVAIAGVVVSPGDIIVADGDGVVVVRPNEAEKVLIEAERIAANEVQKRNDYAKTVRPV
ncbi:RraA family protein [Arthrobacter pigmenti]